MVLPGTGVAAGRGVTDAEARDDGWWSPVTASGAVVRLARGLTEGQAEADAENEGAPERKLISSMRA